MKKSKIVSVLIGAALFLAVALPVVFLESVIGGFIMKLFGFRYDSMRSVFLFFMVAAVADAPLEILAKALPKAMMSLGWIRKSGSFVLWYVLDMLFEMMTLAGADLFMDSVRAEAAGLLVVSALSSAITVWLDRKDEDSPGNEIKENKHGKD